MTTNELKKQLMARTKSFPISPQDFLSSGSTRLNLACSGRRSGAFAKGTYNFLVGDSASGKTFLSHTILAEACRNKHFDDYRLVLNDPESGSLMDVEKFFGTALLERLERPNPSATTEEFYDFMDDLFKANQPFITILDSMDSLSCEADDAKFQERKAARRKGTEVSGSYGVEKAKLNSSGLRRIIPELKRTGSILIIISQTRDNLGFGFDKKTRAGGRALRFYATLELWTSIKGKLKKSVKGVQRQVGILCQIQVKKNRISGREQTVEIPIYYDYGMDDVGSCVDYLVAEGKWKKSGRGIGAGDLGLHGTRDELVQLIEEQGREKELQIAVADAWNEIEEALKSNRKRRYE